jgi:peptide deformylase
MLATMYADNGIGLAAPQVGVNKRLMVFNEFGDPEDKESEMVLANPIIIDKSSLKGSSEEGCLSFPNMYGEVERHYRVTVDYQDITGQKKKIRLEGYPAVIFQHEYDHLDKVLLIDRFSSTDKKRFAVQLQEMIDRYGPGAVL